jgi:short-subunit dehydrogenase
MKVKLKPIDAQVIVITGATSGIGLTTARRAASEGARLVLVARNEDALKTLCTQLNADGSQGERAIYAVADVGDEQALRAAAALAVERFGGFDTWINNAGISIYGKNEEVSLEDQRRLFDTNFWGVVHGSRIAVEHLRERGGALINLGSEASDAPLPLQGVYAASKHAVKGYTDSLRVELQHDGAPVSVTLIKPAGIDTMFTRHAKNYMDVEPLLPKPVYAPELVAEAILHAAQTPARDISVGAPTFLARSGMHHMPKMVDRLMRTMFSQQRSTRPENAPGQHALYEPGEGLQERSGGANGKVVLRDSLMTRAQMHPAAAGLIMLGAAGVAWLALGQSRRRGWQA